MTTGRATIRPERVTRAHVRDVDLPDGFGTLALITLDNDHAAPTTLGPEGLAHLTATLRSVQARATAGELGAVAITGKPGVFAAGADLTQVAGITTRAEALELGRRGHAALRLLSEMGVPTFAFINGIALGGGLEVALNCDYRTVASDVRALGLPETSLGLVPGWGGAYLVPRLVGVEAALTVVLNRPEVKRPYAAREALEVGLVDVLFEPDGFVEESIGWVGQVLGGLAVPRRPLDDAGTWSAAVAAAGARLGAVVHGSRPAPARALDLIAAARTATRDEAFTAEDEALADLIMTDEMRASVYAFSLVSAAKHPTGAPDTNLTRPVTRVGVVGAGLMAAQLAVLFAQRLGVPVVMRDLDSVRVEHGLAAAERIVRRQCADGRLSASAAERALGLVSGTTELGDLTNCDLVIEAITEDLALKQRVFAELESVVAPTTILATNTSALSVTQMAEGLGHPERVVGMHFFNPVAAMPLIEIVATKASTQEALATAFAVAGMLRKTAVLVCDRPGFVVNRLLVLLLGVIVAAVDEGTPVEVADRTLDPLGLPMGPFALLDLVGTAVGHHVLTSLAADLGDRFPQSAGLAALVESDEPLVLPSAGPGLPRAVDPAVQGIFNAARTRISPAATVGLAASAADAAPTGPELLDRVLTALTHEASHMLAEGVVTTPEQIDLCMILGAGWGFHLGGLLPYLDRTGYSERVLGHRFLAPGVADVGRVP